METSSSNVRGSQREPAPGIGTALGTQSDGRSSLLAEREGVVQVIVERCLEASKGRGSFIALQGEAGMGKSRLLDEVADRLKGKSILTLRAQCTDRTGRAPFLPLVEGVNYYLAQEPSSRLQEIWKVYLERHAELHFLFAGGPQGPGDPALWTTHIYFQLAEVLGQLSRHRRGLVLILDDFHLVDASSLGFLQFLSRRIDEMHLAVVLALRPEELVGKDDLKSFLHETAALGTLELVTLEALSPQATSALLETSLASPPSADLVKQLYEESRGNPLYLQELLVEAGRPKPRPLPSEKGRLSDLILARFYSLDPEIQALLTTAAVGGEVVHLEALQGAMEMPPQAFHRLLSAAIQRGFLEETGSGHGRVLRFRHRRVRQVLLEQVPDLEQRRLRHLLGLALEKSLGHRRPTHEVYDLAHFFRDGPDLKRAATYLYEAATMADDAYAGSVALEYYRTLTEREGLMEALTPEQRYRVRFRCAYLYYMAGDSGSAIRQLELIDRFPDVASKVRTHAWWSYYLADNLELPRAIRVARRAVALGRGTKEGVYAQSFLVRNLIDANRFDEARTLARRVEKAWRRYRWSYHDKLTFATFEVHAAHLSFDLRKVLAKQQDMLKLAQTAEDPIRELRSYQVLMSLYDDLDDPQRSLEYSSMAIDMGKTWKVADAELEAAMQHAQVQARLGTGLTEAIKINDQALHRLKDLGIRWLIPSTVARLVELLPHAGKADEIQKYLDILEEHLGPHGRAARAPLYRYLHALACFAKGEGEEALVHLQAASKAGLDIADVPYTIDLELGLAKAHLLLGRHEKARTHAQKAVDLAPSQRPVRGRSGALMILARCDAAQGRRLKAKERAEEALELLRTCGYTLLEPEAEALLQDLGG